MTGVSSNLPATFAVTWILVGACVVSSPSSLETERQILASVGDEPVYVDDFRSRLHYQTLPAEEGAPAVSPTPAQKTALLANMIEERLLMREAERHNIVVGTDEIDAALARMTHGWEKPTPDNDCPGCVLDQVLAARKLTRADLNRNLRTQLMIQKFFRDFVFARIPVTDTEIETYIAENPETLLRPERVHAKQILLKTEEQARAVLVALRRGASFEDAAIEHSLAVEGKHGGDLGWFPRGVMPKFFDETCFSLRPGAVSPAVRSDYGFHIFKIIDRTEAGERALDEVRDEVERKIRASKEARAEGATIAELRAKTPITIQEALLESLP